MRILYVHNSADRYGASRSLLRLVRRLPRDRYEATVVLPEHGPLEDELGRAGVDVIVDEGLSVISRDRYAGGVGLAKFLCGIPASAWRLRRIIRERKIDLVHTNVATVVSPALAAWMAGVKHVWHVRDWFQEFRRMWFVYERYIRMFSDRVVAVSKPIARQFRESGKVVVINNGFDLEEFEVDREALRRTFRGSRGIGMNEFVVGCVGRIKLVRKGQEVLVRAVGRLKRKDIPVRLVLAGVPFPGNEDHLEKLKELVREEGIEANTIFTGEVSDTTPVYSAMDVLVLPSCQPEPFGGVVVEGMAMGLPVVATGIGGSIEQVEDGVTGFLVEPENDAELAQRIAELAHDGERTRRMGEAGRERMKRLFLFDDMLAKFLGIYDELEARPDRGLRPPLTRERKTRVEQQI